MGFNVTPTPGQLKEMLPEVATKMEQQLVLLEMRKMNIQYKAIRRRSELILEVPLTHGFIMRIRAVDVGPGGREFYTLVRLKPSQLMNNRAGERDFKETVRAHVEISGGDLPESFSYTLHEESLKRLIQAAIEGFYQTRNIMLKPLPKRSLGNRN